MKDLASHVMDIVQNSITAGSTEIRINLEAEVSNDAFLILISDNGCGMSKEMLEKVTSPFTTTRTTRKVGLGIPLLKAGCENTGGAFSIESEEGAGTSVKAVYVLSSIDRPPIGDIEGVLSTLVLCNESVNFFITLKYNENIFYFDESEIKKTLDGVPLTNPDVSKFILDYLAGAREEVFGGNFE